MIVPDQPLLDHTAGALVMEPMAKVVQCEKKVAI